MAGYLINKMPSSSISNKCPHFILFPYEPLFHILPHVFGSTCSVNDLNPSLDKLKARAIKCIFLGYSRTQKGHSCYSLTNNYLSMFVDVTFFEDTPLSFN